MTNNVVSASRSALASAVDRERLGQLHPALRPEPVAIHPDYAEEKAAELALELRDAGLLDRDGRPTAELVDWLIPLCRPSKDYVAYCGLDDGTAATVVSAIAGSMGVVAVAHGDDIHFREIGQFALLDELFAELPELRPAQGDLVTVNLERARQERASVLAGPPNRTMKWLRGINRLDARRTIDITMHTYTDGHRRRFRAPLGIKMTDKGDFFSCLVGTGRDKELWAGPAAAPYLHKAVGALRSDLVLAE
ncbi:MAG: ESX secretion-associated protein EspG [Thermocrispum sp.]